MILLLSFRIAINPIMDFHLKFIVGGVAHAPEADKRNKTHIDFSRTLACIKKEWKTLTKY